MVRTIRQEGYVALVAVLITAAVATAAALAILDTAGFRGKEINNVQQAVQARQLAEGCAEEALQLINTTNTYTGSGSLTLGGNTCTYTVTSTGSTTRTIVAVGVVGNTTKRLQAYATIGSSTISITSWQEVV